MTRLTRSITLLFTLMLAPAWIGCSPINWERGYESGMKRAQQSSRRALVQFHSMMSPACREMDGGAFDDPDVQRLIKDYFVPIRVDNLVDRKLAEQFGVEVLPTFIIFRPDGTPAGTQSGKLDAEKFRMFLIRHAYD